MAQSQALNGKRKADAIPDFDIEQEDLVELAQKICKKVMSKNDASHDYAHAFRVANTANELARKEPDVDVLVIRLAAILHDIGDHKYAATPTEADAIFEKALNALQEAGLSRERSTMIRFIIDNVSFSKNLADKDNKAEKTLGIKELAVVQDADKLDAIGAIGIARTFTFGGARKRSLYDPSKELATEVLNLSKEEYEVACKDGATYDHFYEKLLRLKNMMKTDAGKQRAQERHDFMELFLKQFRGEVNGTL